MDAAITRRLPADSSAPGVARHAVAEVLGGWANPADAILVVSELVTNAVVHGITPITLSVTRGPALARITVTSGQADLGSTPHAVDAGPDDLRGRGLAIVAAISVTWNWSVTDGLVTTWAEVADSPT